MNREEIEQWLILHEVEGFTINTDLSVDCIGEVDLSNCGLRDIPVKFRDVHTFDCSYNQLTSLKNSPDYVAWYFDADSNNLKTLQHVPKYVGGALWVADNSLVCLDVMPGYLGSELFAHHNNYAVTNDNLQIRSSMHRVFISYVVYKINPQSVLYDFSNISRYLDGTTYARQ